MSTRDVFGSYLLDYSGRSNLSGGYLAILQTKNTAILEGVGFREKSPKLKKNSPSRPWTDPLASPSSASGAEACGQPDSCRHAPLTTLRSRNLSGSPGAWRGGPVGSWTLELQQSSRRRPTGLRHEWPETAGGIPPIGSAQDWDDRPPMPLVGDAYRDRDPQRQEAIGPRYGGQGDGTGSRGSCSRTICDGSFRNSGASIQGAHRGLSASPGSRTEPSRQQPTVPKPPCAGSRIAGSRPASWPPSKQSQQRWDTRSDWSRKGISRGWHSTRR